MYLFFRGSEEPPSPPCAIFLPDKLKESCFQTVRRATETHIDLSANFSLKLNHPFYVDLWPNLRSRHDTLLTSVQVFHLIHCWSIGNL